MRISARADYAVRAVAELALHRGPLPLKGERISKAQDIPLKFLENILVDLRRAGIVRTFRGAEGGYQLARDPGDVTLADVIRAVDGPLANVRDMRPEEVAYEGAAEHLREVWVAVRASLRSVLEHITLADLVAGKLPQPVRRLTKTPDAWEPH